MKRILYTILLINLIVALYSCKHKETNATNGLESTIENDDRIFVSKAQFKHNTMTLGTIEEKPFPTTIKATGMIDAPPENKAVVNATMGGYIKTTPLLVGDKVLKGQVLVTLENPDFVQIQQNYMEVKEQLTFLKAEFERQQTMKAENITSQKSYLQAESSYKSALARYKGLRKQIQLLNISIEQVEKGKISSVIAIYAPISGSITKINVTKGSYVSPATEIMEIIDNDHIHLELAVFEKDIMKTKKGQKIEFKIPEASEYIYKAEVHLVGTAIENNRTIKVHGHLEDESQVNFLPGMFVKANIITESLTAKGLPEKAIVEVEGENFAMLLDEETGNGYYFKQIKVIKGNSYSGYSEILNGNEFKENSAFLINGVFSLAE